MTRLLRPLTRLWNSGKYALGKTRHYRCTRCIGRSLKHPSFRIVFTVPVLLQLMGAVSLVGYLSFRNGQQAVQNLASQLRGELSSRIERELQSYFGEPHAINRINATALTFGDLDIVRASHGENLLFQQMRIYPTIAFIYCGSARSGEFFGVLRQPDTGELQLTYSNRDTDFFREFYSLDIRGSRLHWIKRSDKRYDSRSRPWFRAALEAEQPAWTDVYVAFTTGLPNVTASLPVYDNRGSQLLGVCATDVVLPEEFRSFLKSLQIGKSGEAFVVDRSGHLISSSTDEPLMVGKGEKVEFLQAVDSQNPLVQQSVQVLLSRYGQLQDIQDPQQLDFTLNGQRQFLEVLPFNDGFGLDWLIVVVVPEADFMAQIEANTRITIGLCIIALVLALLFGVLTSRWVTAPIVQLNAAVKEIAEGQWTRPVHLQRQDEIGELAQSVNRMARQLQESFQTLEAQRNSFARFFPPEYLTFLDKDSVTEIELGDHVSKAMAVMFSDIRYFTSMAEKMAPQEIFDFINAYSQRISPEIRAHHGFVVKFIGDGMMAIFPDAVEDAIDASIAQLQRIQEYNIQRQAAGHKPIDVGIGIHFGRMMVGLIGEPNRMQGDALSDTVNLAARLEGLTKLYGVSLMISEPLLDQLQDPTRYQFRFLDRVIVKGRTEPIAIYEVLDAESEENRQLKLQTLPEFEIGVTAYCDRNLESAKALFEQVLAINTSDRAARLYLERIDELIRLGVPENWTGIWSFTQK